MGCFSYFKIYYIEAQDVCILGPVKYCKSYNSMKNENLTFF